MDCSKSRLARLSMLCVAPQLSCKLHPVLLLQVLMLSQAMYMIGNYDRKTRTA